MKKIFVMLGCLSALSGAQGTEVHSVEAFNQKIPVMKNPKRTYYLTDVERVSSFKKVRGEGSMLKDSSNSKEDDFKEKLGIKFFFNIQNTISSSLEYDLEKSKKTFNLLIFDLCNVIKLVKQTLQIIKKSEGQENWPDNLLGAVGMVCARYPEQCFKIENEKEKDCLGISNLYSEKEIKKYGRDLLEQHKDCNEAFFNCYDFLEE